MLSLCYPMNGPNSTPTVALHGFYHTFNLGDYLIREILTDFIRNDLSAAPLCITPPTPPPNRTSSSLPRPSLTHTLLRRIPLQHIPRYLQSSSASFAILGGGGYLNDGRGAQRLARYTLACSLWNLSRVPYVLAAVGAGPISTPIGRHQIAHICEHAQGIIVRDSESADLLTDIGVHPSSITVTADLVLAFDFDNIPAWASQRARRLLPLIPGRRRLGLHIQYPNYPAINHLHSLIEVLADQTGDSDVDLVWLFDTFVPNTHLQHITRISHKLGITNYYLLPYEHPWVTTALLPSLDTVITTKFHVGLLVWLLGKPTCGYWIHPKTPRFYHRIGRSPFQAPIAGPITPFRNWVRAFVSNDPSYHHEHPHTRHRLRSTALHTFDVLRAEFSSFRT